MNIRAAAVLIESDDLVGDMARFISLNPLSQSALLAGNVRRNRNSGFSLVGICANYNVGLS